jgi:cytochrome c
MKKPAVLLLALLACGAAHADGDPQAGEAVFRKTCAGCHAIGRAAQHTFGPQLNGVFGRTAGTSPGYKYSDELQASGIVWSAESLSRFVADPGALVPGTRMRLWGLSDAQKIADLLAFLQANP